MDFFLDTTKMPWIKIKYFKKNPSEITLFLVNGTLLGLGKHF